jgi:uroporphyrinogen-III synthase
LKDHPLDNVDAFVMTSPSSFDALHAVFDLKHHRLVAMGSYTAQHLAKQGLNAPQLPGGELSNLLEVLPQ